MSQDLEDICSVLGGTANSVREILNCNPGVRTYIAAEFSALLQDRDILEEAAHGFIGCTPEGRPRAARLMAMISEIATM
jgi:hypothetical protein